MNDRVIRGEIGSHMTKFTTESRDTWDQKRSQISDFLRKMALTHTKYKKT